MSYVKEKDDNIFTFVWRIENFSMCGAKTGKFLRSQVFNAEVLGGTQWYLVLYPRGNFPQNGDYVALFLYRSRNDRCAEDIEVKFILDIIDKNSDALESLAMVSNNKSFKKSDSSGHSRLIEVKKLSDEMKKWHEDVLTIRCRIQGEKPKSWCEANTKIDFNKCSFNYFIQYPIPRKYPRKKEIIFTEISSVNVTVSDRNNAVFILIEARQDLPQFFKCKVTLLTIEGIGVSSECSTHLFGAKCDIWEFPTFIHTKELERKKNIFVKDGKVNLLFEFVSNGLEFRSDVRYSCGDPNLNLLEVNTATSLRDDFHKMFVSRKYADVQLRVNKKLFPAHKFVLSARSPVFSRMFDNDMIETKSGVVTISDVDSETMDLFLKYLYTGIVDNLCYENALKLLIVADKYQVLSLNDSCSNFLMTIMCVRNVCEILHYAAAVNHKALQKSAMEYIKSNAAKVLPSPQWAHFVKNDSKLSSEILSKYSADFKNLKFNPQELV